ncbi:MAG: uroporphyrinogen-III C-methyltransferase [Acutalibacteraceae bacterium]|nr:uroporphyrinogen-III C-methyltransferase [Acutalibacteraceae bacterium]
MKTLRAGTRGSALALRQTALIAEELQRMDPELTVEPVIIRTSGDRIQDRPLADAGGKGLFVRELESAMERREIDFAVHSAKDLPSATGAPFCIPAVSERENPADLLISRPDSNLETGVIGTASPRREAMAHVLYPDCKVTLLRGNVPTRIQKLQNGEYDAILLAAAGVNRLGIPLDDLTVRKFQPSEFVPAACQGIIACEALRGSEAEQLLRQIDHPKTHILFDLERELMKQLGADCHDAVGVHAEWTDSKTVRITAFYRKPSIVVAELSLENRKQELENLARKMEGHPFVYLAGAGPGNPDYTTKRTRDLLKDCDVVIYDYLADETLLSLCRPDCEKLYAGKRAGHHSMRQDEITALLLRKAQEGKTVVRLKGGDPFVFGRGGEECQALQSAGIPYEVVPGVTSAISVPMAAGIPVTHRGVSNMFSVITGHSADGSLTDNLDFSTLARMDSTLVFLMGLHALPNICHALQSNGMDGSTPAAVISNGTRSGQYVLRSTLAELPALAAADPHIVTPATIVIGKCAALDMTSPKALPLAGTSTTVCGTASFCRKMSLALEREGGAITPLPLLQILPVEDETFSQALDSLSDYTYVVFTGRNAIDRFFEEFYRRGMDIRQLGGLKVAVIGAATGAYLKKYHIAPDLCPKTFTSDGLAEELIRTVGPHDRLLIPRAVKGNRVLSERLSEQGINFTEARVYDTGPSPEIAAKIPALPESDYLVFASSEGVREYFAAGGSVTGKTVPVCIGKYTADSLREYTDAHTVISGTSSVEGLVHTILIEVENS